MRRSLLPPSRENAAAEPPTDEGPRARNDFLTFAAPAAEAGPHPALRATFSHPDFPDMGITMADEPENLVLQLLRGIRADMATGFAELRADMATKAELAELRAELKGDINSLRADVASDFLTLRAEVKADFKAMGDQVAGISRAVFEYHPP